nr:trypsin-like peptidase domain-containing protein [uncultured Rhodopila sp.]
MLGRIRLALFPILLLAAPASGFCAWADQPPNAVASIVANVQNSVMRIVVVHPPEKSDGSSESKAQASDDSQPVTRIGSGFVIDPSGLVATNRHVVENTLAIFVGTPDGGRYRAEIVGMPEKADIALLRIHPNAPLPAIRFGNSDKLRPGDTVIAIGSPFGFDNTVTAGIVSSVNRDIMESPFDDYIQTDAAINHGNSGGPLFNMAGEVVGMTSVLYAPGTYSGSVGLGFAIPSNDLSFVFSRLEKYGEVRAGMLPLRTQQVTALMAQAIGAPGPGGALIDSMGPRADEMDNRIRPGDIIRTFNGETIIDPRDLARKAARAPIGSMATLGLCRSGTMMSVEVPILPFEEHEPKTIVPGPPPKTLGLQLAAADDADGTHRGVTVSAIDPMGSVADSGLRAGDVILRVQQQTVSSPAQAEDLLHDRVASKERFAAVLVQRDDKQTWIPIALPEE